MKLVDITSDNWEDVIFLSTNETITVTRSGESYEAKGMPSLCEDHVASNALSIVESVYEDGWVIKAIEHEGKLIGFTMYGWSEEEEFYELCRLMIDFHYQNQGYGTQAIRLILEEMTTHGWMTPEDLSNLVAIAEMTPGPLGINCATFTGTGSLAIPAFGLAEAKGNGLFTTGSVFPALFITIACGAISGFHSLVSSGTTAKQIDNERDAQPIGYGAMLIECVVAVLSLCAVGYVWTDAVGEMSAETGKLASAFASPTAVFATGISKMIGSFTNEGVQNIMYQMLVLAVSVFCLTSLDTATRLARYMFQEFWLVDGETPEDVKDGRKILVNPYFATAVTVVLGIALGMTGYAKIWPLFGAANQLLAALGLIAVCAWLGDIGRNNKMFFIPMCFMLVVTIASLLQTITAKLSAGGDIWNYIQAMIAILLVVLAVVLAIIAFRTLSAQAKKKN